MTPTARHQSSYRVAEDSAAAERERRRLNALAARNDPKTMRVISACGIERGWNCLEVGAGSGSISRWLVDQVCPGGSVLSVDVDLRFHCDPVPGMEVRRLDIVHDPLPRTGFDLIHARALLEHLAEREEVLDGFVKAARPGGWIVVEDGDWRAFDAQPLPDPLATVLGVMRGGTARRWAWDTTLGSRLLRMLDVRGLVELDLVAESHAMRNDHTGDWYYLGMETAADRLVGSGAVTREQMDGALALVRSPGFVMMSPLSISVRGRVPA